MTSFEDLRENKVNIWYCRSSVFSCISYKLALQTSQLGGLYMWLHFYFLFRDIRDIYCFFLHVSHQIPKVMLDLSCSSTSFCLFPNIISMQQQWMLGCFIYLLCQSEFQLSLCNFCYGKVKIIDSAHVYFFVLNDKRNGLYHFFREYCFREHLFVNSDFE